MLFDDLEIFRCSIKTQDLLLKHILRGDCVGAFSAELIRIFNIQECSNA